MTLQRTLWTVALVGVGGIALAGCEAAAPSAPPAGSSSPAPAVASAVSGSVRQAWQSARKNIADSAELMAEADYAFKPVDTVRSFGQILTHLSGANYVFCAAARGEAAPHAEDAFEASVTARADIIRVLGESLAYCDGAYEAATDVSLAESVTLPFGMGDGPRATALVGNIGHLNEHYGNLVTYFRIKGIVPPSSRGQ